MSDQPCPECRAALPVDAHYVTWCEHCGWNVQPQAPERPRTIFDTLSLSMGDRFGRGLYDDEAKTGPRPGKVRPARVAAYLFAMAVHLTTLAFAAIGVWLIVRYWPNPAALIVGLWSLGAAIVVRPRIARWPEAVLQRERCPSLYAAVDRVAEALGTHPIGGIVVDENFNASFGRAGWRRRSVMRLGLPLFSVLEPEERVALIAHELAHGANGDPMRGFVVGTAVNTMVWWYRLLRPDRIFDTRARQLALGAAIGNVLALALAQVAYAGAFLLSRLLWFDAQRAEYRADVLAASVSGTAAMLRLLDKLHLTPAFIQSVRSASIGTQKAAFFDELHHLITTLPPREMERIRRVERLETSRLDATHPPTAYRIKLLTAHATQQPLISLTRAEIEAIDRELEPFKDRVQARLIDRHRRSLYY